MAQISVTQVGTYVEIEGVALFVTQLGVYVEIEIPTGAEPLVDPTTLTATGTSQSTVDLTWDDTNTDEDGFSIERSPTGLGTWAVIATTPSLLYTDTGLSPTTAYDYRVRAYRGLDFSGYTATATGTTSEEVLSAPTNLIATGTLPSEVELTWDDANVGLSGFALERSPAGAGLWVEIATPVSNFYTDTGLTPGTSYDYRVRAFKA